MNETNKECSACENKDASMHTCRKYRSGTPQETNKEWDEEKMKIIVPMYIQLIKKRDDIYCNELRYIIEKYENIPVLLSKKDTEWKERIEKLECIIEDISSYSNIDGGGEILTLCNQAKELFTNSNKT